MPAKSWTAIYFPVARAHLVVHFGFEMADEFTRNTFPFRFTIPPASLDPLGPRPGPYLFHGGGMQNPHYPLLSTNAIQFMSAASLRSTSSTPASSTSRVAAKAAKTVRPKDLLTENDVLIGRTLRHDFFWKYGGTVSLSVEEETVAHGTPLRKS